MSTQLQPLLHDEIVVLRAPAQVWSAASGDIGANPVHGVYFGDLRLLSRVSYTVHESPLETIAVVPDGADQATFVSLARAIDDATADPGVRVEIARRATTGGAGDTITVSARGTGITVADLVVRIRADLSDLTTIKQGGVAATSVEPRVNGSDVTWTDGKVSAFLSAPGAIVLRKGQDLELRWRLAVSKQYDATANWAISATDNLAVVIGDESPIPWSVPAVDGNDRLSRWLGAALADMDALRMTTVANPEFGFVAAGAPWFFTLFGRDSLWSARFMLPLGTELARDTLRVLAGMQGNAVQAETAEEPGKIMHELRRAAIPLGTTGSYLPPLYFGTVDATALWVSVLYDAWAWGLPDDEVLQLLPALNKALEWIVEFADADGDGLLEYVDTSGHGLTNQGWKDSGDAVQWRDGTLAQGPIALCEVQAYAYEAAMHGAELIEHFGGDGQRYRTWAARLKEVFHASFWIEDEHGAYPAIALDAEKRPVDTVTSNIGHLLGTGLLDDAQSALVAQRLLSPELNSGFGLRTMSTDSTGYWPLSYHGGSVWTHDTAICIAGLARAGFTREATTVAEGLLDAASSFGYRMPELYSGDDAGSFSRPVPYPASCRPQAWAAGAAVSVLSSLLGMEPRARDGVLSVRPGPAVGPITVDGIQLGGHRVSLTVDAHGAVTHAAGATVDLR